MSTTLTTHESRGDVLLDSCVYCADLNGSGTTATVLVEGVERLHYSLLVPDVVRDEVIAKHRQGLDDATTAYENAQRDIRKFLRAGPPIDFPKINSVKVIQEFAERFPYGIESGRIVLLPYPATSHKEIAQRAIQRRKPFKESGSGYRDSLIFETLKEYLLENSGREVAFVSLNQRDFFEDNQLHIHLLDDLKAAGIDPARVKPFSNLKDYVQLHFFPHLQSLDQLRQALQSGLHPEFRIIDWIRTDLEGLLRDEDMASSIVGVDAVHSYVSKCHDPEKVEVHDVRLLPSGDLLVAFSIRLDIEMSIAFNGKSYDQDYDGVCELVGEPDGQLGSATTWIPVSTHVGVSLVLDKDFSGVKSAQIDSLEGRGGYYSV